MDDYYSPYNDNIYDNYSDTLYEQNNIKSGIYDMYLSSGGKVKNNTHIYDYESATPPPVDNHNLVQENINLLRGNDSNGQQDSYKTNGLYGDSSNPDNYYSSGFNTKYYMPPALPQQYIYNPKYTAPQKSSNVGYGPREDQLRDKLFRDGTTINPDGYFMGAGEQKRPSGEKKTKSHYFNCENCIQSGDDKYICACSGAAVAGPILGVSLTDTILLLFILLLFIAITMATSFTIYKLFFGDREDEKK